MHILTQSLALSVFRHLSVHWSEMMRYRYLHEPLSWVTLGLKPDDQQFPGLYNRLLKVGSVYPLRERVKCHAMPEHPALSRAVGTVLGKSHHSPSIAVLWHGQAGPGHCYSSTKQ